MKFLKTFLFTISLTFLSFGVLSLKGFCASVALDGIDVNSLPTIQNNFDVMGSMMMSPEGWCYMVDEGYNALDSYLYNSTGMDVEDHYYNGIALRQEYSSMVDNTPLIADAISQHLYGATFSGIDLLVNGWQFISKSAQSFGDNAKTWFLGKVDSATNKVTDVCSNMVVKMTEQGLSNYSSAFRNMINNNILASVNNNPIKTNYFHNQFKQSNVVHTVNIKSVSDIIYYQYSGYVYCLVPSSDFTVVNSSYGTVPCEGVHIYQNHNDVFSVIQVNDYHTTSVNGKSFVYGLITLYGTWNIANNYLGSFQQALSLVDSPTSDGLVYSYSSDTLSTIQSLLQQLVGKYVDTNTMSQVNTIIREIPIQVVNEGGVTVPEAVVTPEQVAELEALIEEAIELSSDYAVLLDTDVPIDPDPDPVPDYTGTTVPEDFPDTIFSPIDDSIDSIFDFVSIFEPLFYIFSFSTGLLGLWLVVPFVILFLILFRLLK